MIHINLHLLAGWLIDLIGKPCNLSHGWVGLCKQAEYKILKLRISIILNIWYFCIFISWFWLQVELLSSFLTKDRGLRLQVMALKCLRFILAKGMYHFPANSNVTLKLFGVINQLDFPPALHFDALRALCKVFPLDLSNLCYCNHTSTAYGLLLCRYSPPT